MSPVNVIDLSDHSIKKPVGVPETQPSDH
jgi:hypothetical protein